MTPWSRLRRKTAAWLALIAMLAGALLPTVSHALASARGETWTAVCTAQGVRWMAADAASDWSFDAALRATSAGSQGVPGTAAPWDPCPYCTHASHTPALPPASHDARPPAADASPMPALILHVPRTLSAWRGAQPRAPPFLA